MIITTPLKYNDTLLEEVKELGRYYNIPFLYRGKISAKKLVEKYSEVLVVGKEKVQLNKKNGNFTYHPNFSQVRLKRILKGESDPFLDATNLTVGDKFLDCTMGLASDSIIASVVTDDVTALESTLGVYLVVTIGMSKYRYTLPELEHASKVIKTHHINAYNFLKEQQDDSYDVIYFDPMYEEDVNSEGIEGLKHYADNSELTEVIIEEAKRVASKRVVLKAHFNSPLFKRFKFMQCVRKSTVSHYGVILTS